MCLLPFCTCLTHPCSPRPPSHAHMIQLSVYYWDSLFVSCSCRMLVLCCGSPFSLPAANFAMHAFDCSDVIVLFTVLYWMVSLCCSALLQMIKGLLSSGLTTLSEVRSRGA